MMWAGRCISFGVAVAACVLPVAAAAALIAAVDALRRARRDTGENLMSVGAARCRSLCLPDASVCRRRDSRLCPAHHAFSCRPLCLYFFSLALCV